MELIIPLRLMDGAFVVFQQFKEEYKRDFDWMKAALYTGFAADGFMAFDQFVWWLPDRVKSLLCASTRMDGLSIEQLLAQAQASMKDNTMEAGLAVAAVQATQDETKLPDSGDLNDLIMSLLQQSQSLCERL